LKCAAIVKKLPMTKIFISPLLPTINKFLNELVSETNRLIHGVCSQFHNVTMMDNTAFYGSDGLLRESFRGKKPENVVHLNGPGLNALKELFKGYIVGKAAMKGMNYSSALIKGGNVANVNDGFCNDIRYPNGGVDHRLMAGTGVSGDRLGLCDRRSDSVPVSNSCGNFRFVRDDKPNRRNTSYKPFRSRVFSGNDFRTRSDWNVPCTSTKIWDDKTKGFVLVGGSGFSTGNSQSHTQSRDHGGGK